MENREVRCDLAIGHDEGEKKAGTSLGPPFNYDFVLQTIKQCLSEFSRT